MAYYVLGFWLVNYYLEFVFLGEYFLRVLDNWVEIGFLELNIGNNSC